MSSPLAEPPAGAGSLTDPSASTAPTKEPDPASGTDTDGFSLRALARSAVILAGGTAVAQIVAIARELYVAYELGISAAYDAALIALIIPTALAALITSGVVTALVPAYIAVLRLQGRSSATRLAGAVLTWVALITLAASLMIIPLAGPIVSIVGPGLAPADHAAAVGYLETMAPLVFVIGVSGILASVCQAEERFGTIALATVIGPVAGLIITLAAWERLEVTALIIASIVGPAVTALMLLVGAMIASIAPRPRLFAPGLGLGQLVRHALPLTVGASVMQLTIVADRAIASLIAPGAVSALRYAEVLVRLPIGAIGPAWGNAVYPALARAAYLKGEAGLGASTMRLLRLSVVAFVPIAGLTMAVAPVAVGVAYGRGAFTPEDLALTSIVVAAFAPLIVLLMANPVVVDALNARRRGAVLLLGAIVSAGLNFLLDVVLGLTLGIAGIALATSLTIGTVLVVVLGANLTHSDPDFRISALGRPAAASIVAAAPGTIVFGILAWSGVVTRDPIPAIAFLCVAGIAGLASYVVLAIRMGIEEPLLVIRALRSRLGHGAQAGA